MKRAQAVSSSAGPAVRRTAPGPCNFVRWNWNFDAPPLCIDQAGIDEGMEIISKAVSIADEACV